MTPMAVLEVLGQIRTLGMSAENVGHGVILVSGTHTLNRSGDLWVMRTDGAETVATLPIHWDAEAVAAAVVCVVMLGATTVADEVAA